MLHAVGRPVKGARIIKFPACSALRLLANISSGLARLGRNSSLSSARIFVARPELPTP